MTFKLLLVSSTLAFLSLNQVSLAAHATSDGAKGLYAEEGHYKSDGDSGFYTPSNQHVMSDGNGGFYGLDGHYGSDGKGGLIAPDGEHIQSDGNNGYFYQEVPLFGEEEEESNGPLINESILNDELNNNADSSHVYE